MIKLYRITPSRKEYWETWQESPGRHIVHWGKLGTKGVSETVTAKKGDRFPAVLQARVSEMKAQGFREIDEADHFTLMIEYRVNGMGNSEDLEKRHELEDRMNGTLGWTGLGHCDGGSIGSGSMEVCNYVVDFDLAKQVIEADLAGTEFADYTRIYLED